MVLRAGYARTIGRPELDDIVPSIVVTDPDADGPHTSDHRGGRQSRTVDRRQF